MLKKQLYSSEQVTDAVKRIARAIYEDFARRPEKNFSLVGLYKQGVPLAERIADAVEQLGGQRPETAKLDISLYRDDFGQRSALPLIRETVIPFDLADNRIILVDDVLSTGRTIRAALDAITDYGRPDLIRLAVLVDRGDPEYPIRADYVGYELKQLPADHKVAVEFEPDGIFEVEWDK